MCRRGSRPGSVSLCPSPPPFEGPNPPTGPRLAPAATNRGDTALLTAVLLLVLMSNYAERSFEVRADGLSSLFGLLSLVVLLRGRPFAAGALATLSFLCTQKGIYFVFAGGVAVTAVLLLRRT